MSWERGRVEYRSGCREYLGNCRFSLHGLMVVLAVVRPRPSQEQAVSLNLYSLEPLAQRCKGTCYVGQGSTSKMLGLTRQRRQEQPSRWSCSWACSANGPIWRLLLAGRHADVGACCAGPRSSCCVCCMGAALYDWWVLVFPPPPLCAGWLVVSLPCVWLCCVSCNVLRAISRYSILEVWSRL